jgi:hypothetical protein
MSYLGIVFDKLKVAVFDFTGCEGRTPLVATVPFSGNKKRLTR